MVFVPKHRLTVIVETDGENCEFQNPDTFITEVFLTMGKHFWEVATESDGIIRTFGKNFRAEAIAYAYEKCVEILADETPK